MLRGLTLLCLGFLTIACQGAAIAEKRVALVIGNSSYANVPTLRQPAKDAEAVGALLKSAGFDNVTIKLDLGLPQMRAAIRSFADETQDASIAVIFYSGHGVELDGTNYLIPVDAKLADVLDTQYETVSLDRFIDAIKSTGASRRLNLIMLDACRDSSFPIVKRQRPNQRSAVVGRPVEPTDGHTLIAYSCKQGSAEDGDGDHSPFTQALLKSLTVRGLDIRLALGRVRSDVLAMTANKQEPFVYGELGGGYISLVPATAKLKEDDAGAEADFKLVTHIGTKKAFEVFLQTHKTGKYADLIRARLRENNFYDPSCPAAGRNQDASIDSIADQLARCGGQRKRNDIEKR